MSDEIKEFDLTNACIRVSERHPELLPDQIRDILTSFFEVTTVALGTHSRVEYKGFGVLSLRLQSEKSGVDPQGEPWHTPERVKVVYKPWPTVKHAIAVATKTPVV